jgi:hypothetical protein
MQHYDPDVAPPAAEWLATDEGERTTLVETYHRNQRIKLPQERLHAAIHVVVESQIALGEQVVLDAMARLQAGGLTRHDAIHALGHVVAEHIQSLLKATPTEAAALHAPYLERVRQLGVPDTGH